MLDLVIRIVGIVSSFLSLYFGIYFSGGPKLSSFSVFLAWVSYAAILNGLCVGLLVRGSRIVCALYLTAAGIAFLADHIVLFSLPNQVQNRRSEPGSK